MVTSVRYMIISMYARFFAKCVEKCTLVAISQHFFKFLKQKPQEFFENTPTTTKMFQNLLEIVNSIHTYRCHFVD